MRTDVYSAFAQRLGTTRAEAKRRAYERVMNIRGVEVLAPGEKVPAAVQYPQVVEHHMDLERDGWAMKTLAGQRFLVPVEVAEDFRQPADQLFPEVLLGEALAQHRAVWL